MIFISILTLIVAKALPSLNKNISSISFLRISSIIFIYAGVLSFNSLYIQSIGSGIGIYSGLFHITLVSQLMELFLLIIGSLILMAWPISAHPLSVGTLGCYPGKDYSLIVLFSSLGASLLISSADLVSMYLSIELQSFGLYVLATLYRDSESSTSAGLKYFLLGGLSSCIILLGCGLIYAYTGLSNLESLYSLISVKTEFNFYILGFSLGLVLIIVGFLFKIAAAPLHHWSPDVYDETPTIVTIWLTIMPKISILILLLELHTQIGSIGGLNTLTITLNGYAELLNLNFELLPLSVASALPATLSFVEQGGEGLKILLLLSSLLSLIIGTVVGLAQTKIKRLLAYSTISHIGFLLLALAINTEQSIDSLFFYLIQYTITNLNVFLIIIAFSYLAPRSSAAQPLLLFPLPVTSKGKGQESSKSQEYNADKETPNDIKDVSYISQLKGQFFKNPLLSLSLSVCLFSMAGMPPLIGFFSKQFVLYSAVQSGYYLLALLAILVSVISASYYLKIIKVLNTEIPTPTSPALLCPMPKSKGQKDGWSSLAFLPANPANAANAANTGEEGHSNSRSYFSFETVAETVILSNFHSFLISSLSLIILFFILKPSLILNSTQLLSLSLFNY